MKRRRRILLAALGLAVAAVLVAALWPSEKEPEYQGRKLSAWLVIYSAVGKTNPTKEQAADAVRHIGTNALPFLVKWIDYEPTTLTYEAANIVLHLPASSARATALNAIESRGVRASAAVFGFQILQDVASPVIPALTRMSTDWHSRLRSSRALLVLTFIGKDGLQPLVAVMTNKAAPNALRCGAAQLVADPMMNLGTNALLVARAMLPCLEDMSVAACFVDTLGLLQLVPDEVVPALDRCLRSPDVSLRVEAARALGQFRAQASSAVPHLLLALNDPDQGVRITVTNALLNIAPDALKKEER